MKTEFAFLIGFRQTQTMDKIRITERDDKVSSFKSIHNMCKYMDRNKTFELHFMRTRTMATFIRILLQIHNSLLLTARLLVLKIHLHSQFEKSIVLLFGLSKTRTTSNDNEIH